MGIKFKYQFDDVVIEANNSKNLTNSEDNEPSSKKFKLNDNKKTSILEYSSIQLPVAPFINYLEKYSTSFVNQCLKHNNSQE